TASYGQTSLSTTDLKPEKSRSYTAGIVLRPIDAVTISLDYYNIKKTGAITTASPGVALAAYSAGTPIPPEYNIIVDSADPKTPGAQPRIAFIQSKYINADTVRTSGVEGSIDANFDINDNVRFSTTAQAA